MQQVTIKMATPEDAAVIAELSRSTFYETFAQYNTKENIDKFLNEQFTTESLMLEVGEAGNIFLLVYHQNEPVGYARLRDAAGPEALTIKPSIELARIYLKKEVAGKGIGGMLMEYCIATARNMQKKAVWLGVWEKNVQAIGFYRKWGFEKFGEHDFILGNEIQCDWLMLKEI